MQLTLNLTFTPATPVQPIFKNNTWLEAGWATACLGFTKKVEVSQSLLDALAHFPSEEDDLDQPLYDALWLAHHYLVLDQRPSFSFLLDFLHNHQTCSLRLHVEEKESVILLGLLQDF